MYVVATPIGNLSDMTVRGVEALKSADVIACEDTRRTRILLDHYSIPPRELVAYHEHNEQRCAVHLSNILESGRKVALCTDGGMPGISDPGYRVVCLAVEKGIPIEVIPGGSAVEVALVTSGLPTSSYTFKGFPPRKPGPARRFFEVEKELPHTMVVFESPFRVGATLRAALAALGDRRAAVCIELTKKFERVSRGYLSELCPKFEGVKVKGEVTIVIAGSNPKFSQGDAEADGEPEDQGQQTPEETIDPGT